MNFAEFNFKALQVLKNFPYKNISYIAIFSFILSFSVSLYFSKILLPDFGKKNKRKEVESSLILERGGATLSDGDIGKIIERNIFNIEGKTGDTETIVKRDKETIDEVLLSQLPMKLVGVIYGGDKLSGLALIERSKDKSINSFFVGDEISADVFLIEVHQQKIIIQNGKFKEFMELDPFLLPQKRQKGKAKKKTVDLPTFALDAPPDSYKEEGFERVGSEIVMSQEFRQKLLTTDFTKVLQDAKAEPYFEGNELKGFRLVRVRQDSIYQKSGLQNDDIIREINGVQLVDTAQAIRLLNSLRNESSIEMQIKRGSKMQTINVQVR
ncbi:MAG: hypothetical protein CMP11_02850 [Zetaproteobacteria bacterium]|nr:hypothetical protein [Pseudobdellovibrionaceae bacterium]|tara:strand:- start:4314 stop:5288 length:975 start_codon:yes stop_codon:yes gene_type:complete